MPGRDRPRLAQRAPGPRWRAALLGITWVVAMAAVLGLAGLALAWLATVIL